MREATDAEWFAGTRAQRGELTGPTSQRKWWPLDSGALVGEKGTAALDSRALRCK